MTSSEGNKWGLSGPTKIQEIDTKELAKEIGQKESAIKDVIAELGIKAERKEVATIVNGRKINKFTLFCNAADAERIRRYFGKSKIEKKEEEGIKQMGSPEGYVTLSALRFKLGVTAYVVRGYLTDALTEMQIISKRSATNSIFGGLVISDSVPDYVEIAGRVFVSPNLAEKIEEIARDTLSNKESKNFLNIEAVMVTLSSGTQTSGVSKETFIKEVEHYIKMYPQLSSEVIEKSSIYKGDKEKFFSLKLVSIIKTKLNEGDTLVENEDDLPSTYVSHADLANQLLVTPTRLTQFVEVSVTKMADANKPILRLFLPEVSKKLFSYYSPELVERIKIEKSEYDKTVSGNSGLEDLEQIDDEEEPDGYVPVADLALSLSTSINKVKRFADEIIIAHHGLNRPVVNIYKNTTSVRPRQYYSPELVMRIRELKASKDAIAGNSIEIIDGVYNNIEAELLSAGYKASAVCAVDLGIRVGAIPGIVRICLAENNRLKDSVKYIYKKNRSKDLSTFYGPELIEMIREKYRQESLERSRKIEEAKAKAEMELVLKNKLSELLTQIESEASGTELFRKLLSLFGGARAIDLLLKLYPEFEGISRQYISREVSSYLTDYLVVRSENVLDDLMIVAPYLDQEIFCESLYLAIKSDIVLVHGYKKKQNINMDSNEILTAYIEDLKLRSAAINSSQLEEIVQRINDYITSLQNDFQKPSNVIDELKPGRQFPDLNQVINIKEVAEQRRLLIGDEMGMGKSASAILSKEYLMVKTAVVVVPSNVMDVWHDYLSDKTNPKGEQIGYFKLGHAPKILEIKGGGDLNQAADGNYDYILISHERMDEEASKSLKNIACGMVIIDEAHKFKNITYGKRSRALIGFLEECNDNDAYTVLLSGTPIPNKVKDIASILKILFPEEYGQMESQALVASIIRGDVIDIRELLQKRMQMKKLSQSIEMPAKSEHESYVELGAEESFLYDVLMQDHRLSATERLSAMRLFCLNPQKVFPYSGLSGTKLSQAEAEIKSFFDEKRKLVLFVNGYVDGVIRGDSSVIERLKVPDNVTVRIIDGKVSREERRVIEEDLRYSTNKFLLIVNGAVADVGVDFSAAGGIIYYNEPWTMFDKQQQTARVYRPGLKGDITINTLITKGTIEEGIHYYIQMKYRAVVKLLEGIPLSDIEKKLLLMDEKVSSDPSAGNNNNFAEEWLETPVARLRRFSKRAVDNKFKTSFMEDHGADYAKAYEFIEDRGIEANTARFVASIITDYVKQKQLQQDIVILDLASGPEMLRKRMKTEAIRNLYSQDINSSNFKEWNGRQIVGSFSKLEFSDSSVDYINLSNAIHFAPFNPNKGEYERLKVIAEASRVLKVGGRLTINLTSDQRFTSLERLKNLGDEFGLAMIDSASGFVSSGKDYLSQVVTFEKATEIDIFETVKELITRRAYTLHGLRIDLNNKVELQDQMRICNFFTLNGRIIDVDLNEEDAVFFEEQENILNEAGELVDKYGSIEKIPEDVIVNGDYILYVSGEKYRLAKKGVKSGSIIYIT